MMRKFFTHGFCFLFGLLPIVSLKAQSGDLYDGSFIHDVRINFEQKNFVEQLDSLRINNSDENMLLGRVVIDGKTYENCGIAYAKSPTYQTAAKRNPWLIKLNFVNKTQNHQGYKSFILSNSLRDPSLVREVLGYEIARKYMPAPKANFVNLTVNYENRGIHTNIEPINEDFLQKNFNYTEGVFFRCVPDTRTETKSDCEKVYGALKPAKDVRCMMNNFDMLSKEGWDDLIELTRVLNTEPQNIYKVINLDRTLWFLAFNNVIVNLNGYAGQFSGNYYLYREKSGQFNFIPTEMNLSFGSIKNATGMSDLDLKGLIALDPMLHADNAAKPLIAQLLKNAESKKIYLAHIRQILADWFDTDLYKRRAEELQRQINSYYEVDKTPPYPLADFKRSLNETVGTVTKIPGIVELMSQRAKFLRKHPDLAILPPVVSEVVVSNRKKFSNQAITEFHIKAKVDKFPRKVRVFYRPANTTVGFAELQMLDDGNNHDGAAGDKVFGCNINPQGKYDSIEYFIIAENAGAITFDPPNYITERRRATLAELNK